MDSQHVVIVAATSDRMPCRRVHSSSSAQLVVTQSLTRDGGTTPAANLLCATKAASSLHPECSRGAPVAPSYLLCQPPVLLFLAVQFRIRFKHLAHHLPFSVVRLLSRRGLDKTRHEDTRAEHSRKNGNAAEQFSRPGPAAASFAAPQSLQLLHTAAALTW